jgi:PAS domain S-box-containing protein
MPENSDTTDKFEQLRKQAEELVRQRSDFPARSPSDIMDLIQELRVQQAELEIQNEELRRTQQQLSGLHHEYEVLYEFAPCGYVTLDNKGIIKRINLSAISLLVNGKHQLLHSGFSQYIMPGWEDPYWVALRKSGESGEKQTVELSLKRDTGSPRWVRADIEADREDDGAVMQWRIILIDITPQKEAEAALLESEKRFRDLFENAPLAYQSLDEKGNFIEVNRTWLQIMGYTKAEVIGKNFSELLHPEWKDHFQENFPRFKAVGEILGTEFLMRKKNGSDILVSFHGKIGRNAKGEFKQTHCVFHDITAQRRAEEDQKRLKDQLVKIEKMEAIGTLAGGIAHDFNNLLMAIQGRVSLMSVDLNPSNPLKEHLAAIEKNIRSAANLTKQMLGYARGGKYHAKPIDIKKLVSATAEMFGRTHKEIQIRTSTQPLSMVVEADHRQIEQVLLNMFVNAWQAMPGGGVLSLVTSIVSSDQIPPGPYRIAPGNYVKISVTDTGIGMDDAVRQRIFDPFFTTKQKGIGTGLGLASAYGIIKNHSGIITVYSEIEQGTTFNIYLPISIKDPLQEAITPQELIEGAGTVLLVDDEEMIIEVGQPMIERLGYHVFVASSGEAAIDVVQQRGDDIDLVILDLVMPGMDGGKTYDRIRDLRPAMPVILSSGYSLNGRVSEIMRRGCKGFIQKPFNISELSQLLRKILDEAQN